MTILAAEVIVAGGEDAPGLRFHILHQEAQMGQPLRLLAGGGELPAGLGRLQLDHEAARFPEPAVVAPAVEIGRLGNEPKPQNIAVKIFR